MKYILCLLFWMLSGVAKAASWEYLTESSDGEMKTYVDISSIKNENGSVRVWTLSNYTKPEKSGKLYYMSSKDLVFVKCGDEKYEIGAYTSYSGSMGNGSVVDSISLAPYEFKWKFVTPDSMISAVVDFVCPVNK